MLRVNCSCGKSLKVDDKLAGKKIKCPACGTVQLVKAAAGDEVQAAPKAPVPNGASAKAAPKSQSRAASAGDSRPRPQKQKSKAGRPVPWLLIGGGVGALRSAFCCRHGHLVAFPAGG